MTRSKLATLLAGALAFVIVAAGAAAAEPLSKKEWRAAATDICTDANNEVIRVISEVLSDLGEGEQPTEDQLADVADGVAPVIEDAVDDVRALDEPSSFKKGVKKWLAAIDDVVERMQDDPSILNQADPFKKANKRAKKLGLSGCV